MVGKVTSQEEHLRNNRIAAGKDDLDATSSPRPAQDYAEGLPQASSLSSRPLAGKRIGIIRETTGAGVAAGVSDAFVRAARHLESMGADVDEVWLPELYLPFCPFHTRPQTS